MADVVLTIGADDDELSKNLKKISKLLERFERRQAGKADKKTKEKIKDERQITRETISEQRKRDANDRRLSRKRAKARLKQIRARIRAEKAADREIERNRRRAQRGRTRDRSSGRRGGGGFGRVAGGLFGAISRIDIVGIGKEIFDFERSIVKFGETAKIGLKAETDLKDAIERVALATGIAQEDLLRFSVSVFDTGGGVRLATDNLLQMGKATVAFNLEAKSSGKLISALSDKFGFSTQGTAAALDIIAAQANLGAISVEDFGNVAPVLFGAAASAGLTGEQGLAEIGALAQLAIRSTGTAPRATTAVSRLLDNLLLKSEKIEKLFNVKTTEGGVLVNPIESIKAIIEAGATTKQLAPILGLRGIKAIEPILKEFNEGRGFEFLDAIIKTGVSAAGDTERIFNRISETASFKLDQLNTMLKALTARAFTKGLTELVTAFTDFLSDDKKVTQLLKDFQDFGDALLTLAQIFNTVIPSVDNVKSFFKTMFTFGFGEEDAKQRARGRVNNSSIFTGRGRGNAPSTSNTTNVTNIKVPRDRLLNDSKTVRVQNVNGTGSINRSRSNGRISAGR